MNDTIQMTFNLEELRVVTFALLADYETISNSPEDWPSDEIELVGSLLHRFSKQIKEVEDVEEKIWQ